MLQRNSDLPYVVPDEPATRPADGWQYPTVDLREMGRILRRRYRMVALTALALLGLVLTYLIFATLYIRRRRPCWSIRAAPMSSRPTSPCCRTSARMMPLSKAR